MNVLKLKCQIHKTMNLNLKVKCGTEGMFIDTGIKLIKSAISTAQKRRGV